MSLVRVATFESKTRGPVEIFRGYDEPTRQEIFEHSTDKGIARTLGGKDLGRFSPEKFPGWITKNGGRFMYVAKNMGSLAGLFWIGAEAFPVSHFPKSELRPQYTAAWRTGYSTPEGGDSTYEGQGIGKRIALAGIADVVRLTKNGGPTYSDGTDTVKVNPLSEEGIWIDTGIGNKTGQALYHHLGNTGKDEDAIGFVDVGVFEPDYKPNATLIENEPRVGMVADPATIERLIAAGGQLLNFVAN